jgi:hypothetical protein
MNRHYSEATNKQVNQSSTEIFRFPTRAELQQAKEQQQARTGKRNNAVTTNYKDDDLSGCLSGSLKGQQKPAEQPKAVVNNYKDEDLSGCLSGNLKSRSTEQKANQRGRFVPTQRNVKTGEITSIEQDDLSAAIDSLNQDKSGWSYLN